MPIVGVGAPPLVIRITRFGTLVGATELPTNLRLDASAGVSYAPITHRLARGGGFHLSELASTATRADCPTAASQDNPYLKEVDSTAAC